MRLALTFALLAGALAMPAAAERPIQFTAEAPAGGAIVLPLGGIAELAQRGTMLDPASREQVTRARTVVLTWLACALLLMVAVVFGRGVGAGFSDEVLAIALGFAGGAVLASLADTPMPEAFEHGRPLNAFATAAGFFLSFVLAA